MKIGRNDSCPCNSGKKYKKCCMLKQENKVTEDDHDDTDIEAQIFMLNAMNHLRGLYLRKKPHIIKYKKIRKLHGEIVNSMSDYYYSGMFEQKIDPDYVHNFHSEHNKSNTSNDNDRMHYDIDFNLKTKEGAQGLFNILIYKPAPNMNCITEEFINKKRYKKPDKIEFLQSMLDSKQGLFEITRVDIENGYAYLKEVFTGEEYTLIDIGMSGNPDNSSYYIYTRIITYHDISFNTGLNMLFKKSDQFIKDFIKRYDKKYVSNGEFGKFIELFNYFSNDPNKIETVSNTF